MHSELVPALGFLAGLLATARPVSARPDIYARSQQIRQEHAQECAEDLADVLDNAPTMSMSWGATACDYVSTLSGLELSVTYASFRSRMSSWYLDDLDDITKVEASCTQYASIFSQIRNCYVTGAVPTAAISTTPTLSSTAVTTTSTGAGGITTATVTTTSTPDSGRGMDDGAKAGLAIGIILAILLLMFIGYKFSMKYRQKKLADAAAMAANGNTGPRMGAAAATAGGAMGAAAMEITKSRAQQSEVFAFKPELSGESRPTFELDPRSISELDPAAAVAARGGATGVHRYVAELDPDPPTELSELPADNYDPTAAKNSPPPAYVSPVADTGTWNALPSAVSPVSPDSSTMQSQGPGVPTIPEADVSHGADGGSTGVADGVPTKPNETVQHGWGRGWMRRA
ncbi:hypothetical protein CORC01_02939 [Colletotrichum orchidophilum]|uniref:Uncharacterized protein n=1 Tax=Colletotrichum orchidophilum TaxID=1209926 RepID=A0A1G4BKB6_9PEZI|nr:uncharacterized protein CORC01_02939 [Colletotrichum orchidophilum]OHF01748.1 hypothetical protein CORC01_02939 [Colletotrichum orchidophilum]